VGRIARIGGAVVVEFVDRTERCVMVNAAQDGLTSAGQVLKAIAAANDLTLGVYARVVRGGTVALGDALRLRS
jgi:MOSC domain-containing protein YiiM